MLPPHSLEPCRHTTCHVPGYPPSYVPPDDESWQFVHLRTGAIACRSGSWRTLTKMKRHQLQINESVVNLQGIPLTAERLKPTRDVEGACSLAVLRHAELYLLQTLQVLRIRDRGTKQPPTRSLSSGTRFNEQDPDISFVPLFLPCPPTKSDRADELRSVERPEDHVVTGRPLVPKAEIKGRPRFVSLVRIRCTKSLGQLTKCLEPEQPECWGIIVVQESNRDRGRLTGMRLLGDTLHRATPGLQWEKTEDLSRVHNRPFTVERARVVYHPGRIGNVVRPRSGRAFPSASSRTGRRPHPAAG